MPSKTVLTNEELALRRARRAEKDRERSRAYRASRTPERRLADYARDRASNKLKHASDDPEATRARKRARYLAWKAANPEGYKRQLASLKAWKHANKDLVRRQRRSYYKRHPEVRRAAKARHARNNRSKINETRRRRRRESPGHRVGDNLCCRLRKLLGPVLHTSSKVSALVGCTRQVLRSHLESKFLPGMGWYNYGSAWHIDHVKPCVSFDLTDREQQLACFHYTNLQPLWDVINVEKGDSLIYDTAYAVALTPYPS